MRVRLYVCVCVRVSVCLWHPHHTAADSPPRSWESRERECARIRCTGYPTTPVIWTSKQIFPHTHISTSCVWYHRWRQCTDRCHRADRAAFCVIHSHLIASERCIPDSSMPEKRDSGTMNPSRDYWYIAWEDFFTPFALWHKHSSLGVGVQVRTHWTAFENRETHCCNLRWFSLWRMQWPACIGHIATAVFLGRVF